MTASVVRMKKGRKKPGKVIYFAGINLMQQDNKSNETCKRLK